MFNVIVKRKVDRSVQKLPLNVKELYRRLLIDLRENGPVQPQWPNFSKLSNENYHCHLGYHHVACWWNENGTITIEVYYVGSREGAPY